MTRFYAGLLALSLLPTLAMAQPATPAPEPPNLWSQAGRPGVAVDARGGQVVDPTKNVLDLVEAAIRRQDDLRAAEARRQDAERTSEVKFHIAMRDADLRRIADLRDADTRRLNELRDAETRRINELATQKQIFDLELARVIRAGLDASTLLLATQLKEVKTDASDRMAKLEQFANEQRGRASATDPRDIKLLEEVRALTASRNDLAGRNTGQDQVVAYIFGAIGVLVGVGGLILAFSRQQHPPNRTV